MRKLFDIVRIWSPKKTSFFWCVVYTLCTLVAFCLPIWVFGSNITAYNTQAFLLFIVVVFTIVYAIKETMRWVRIREKEARESGARASSAQFMVINLGVSFFAWSSAFLLGLTVIIVTKEVNFFWFLFVLQATGLVIGAPLFIYRMAQFYHMKFIGLLITHIVQVVVIFAGVFTLVIKAF